MNYEPVELSQEYRTFILQSPWIQNYQKLSSKKNQPKTQLPKVQKVQNVQKVKQVQKVEKVQNFQKLQKVETVQKVKKFEKVHAKI